MKVIQVIEELEESQSMWKLGAVTVATIIYPILESGNAVRITQLLEGLTAGSIITLLYYIAYLRINRDG